MEPRENPDSDVDLHTTICVSEKRINEDRKE